MVTFVCFLSLMVTFVGDLSTVKQMQYDHVKFIVCLLLLFAFKCLLHLLIRNNQYKPVEEPYESNEQLSEIEASEEDLCKGKESEKDQSMRDESEVDESAEDHPKKDKSEE